MAQTTDTEVARLAEMVASLAVQVASLAPTTNNSNVAQNAPVPIVTTTVAPVAALDMTSPSALPRAPATVSPEVGDDAGDDQQPSGSSAHRRWYVVIVGLQVGVFRGWTNAAPLVLGVAGSIYNREPTRETAITAFNAAAAIGQVRLVD